MANPCNIDAIPVANGQNIPQFIDVDLEQPFWKPNWSDNMLAPRGQVHRPLHERLGAGDCHGRAEEFICRLLGPEWVALMAGNPHAYLASTNAKGFEDGVYFVRPFLKYFTGRQLTLVRRAYIFYTGQDPLITPTLPFVFDENISETLLTRVGVSFPSGGIGPNTKLEDHPLAGVKERQDMINEFMCELIILTHVDPELTECKGHCAFCLWMFYILSKGWDAVGDDPRYHFLRVFCPSFEGKVNACDPIVAELAPVKKRASIRGSRPSSIKADRQVSSQVKDNGDTSWV
jgi:hypothetical protein